MKKCFLLSCLILTLTAVPYAQIMQSDGFRNSLVFDAQNKDPLHGNAKRRQIEIADVFQARMAAGPLCVDTMLKWGAVSVDDSEGNFDHLELKYLDSDVNFIFKPAKNFDAAMGTYLNWKLGPAPTHGGNSWEAAYHLKNGGLSYGLPGQAPVTGAVYYANYINESLRLSKSTSSVPEETTEALAARLFVQDYMEIAAAIPSNTSTDDFIANLGMRFTPSDELLIAAAYNGLFAGDGNLYTGVSFGIDEISVDGWIGINNIGGKKDNRITGFGGAINFAVKTWTLRPEAGLTFYENKDYSMALYAGINMSHTIKENLKLGIWGSLAFGSDDENGSTKTGGKIFDVRPNVTYYINSTDALSAAYEYQFVTVNTDVNYNIWHLGLFWTHAF